WEGDPPRTASEFVQNCVHRLRKVLAAETLETHSPGYRLRVDPELIDAVRFERLVREARELPAREKVVLLRDSLALWRGSPLSDLAYWSFAQDAIRNLEEQRVHALELRLEAELELGLHRDAIGELGALVHEHPTHERLRWLQMLALHRSDRRLDALAAYQETRLAMVEESGMEPGEELRALQRRILQDDPTLMRDGVAEAVTDHPPQLSRKVVAVCIVELLPDDALDVEAARGVVSRGLASLEEIVLRHGGRVEQLLGEEALAVFGLPAAHEDDILRGLRSATELRDALASLPLRVAVETGEVLVGEDGRVLSGGALTTARRVKEAAGEGEILLGPAAAAQSAGAARTAPSEGGARLVELVEGAPAIARRPDAPLVGRRVELERLILAVRESSAASACRRVVVLGEPGIGKTRLAAELVGMLGDEVRVLAGRCVPSAEGATYLPLVEVVEQIAGGEEVGPALHALLADEPDGEQAATRLADALSGARGVDSGDVLWATRKLLERVARDKPLLVALEDVHWAEPTFLDLLEYLVGWSTGHAIALVCLARPELLDARPAWLADTLALRPLGDEETEELLESLPESLALDTDARAAVVAAAEGNPLFLEQLAAHALDAPLEAGKVPASLESLLASRLDSLPAGERAMLERAAVVGREFTRAAVDALSRDDERGSASALLALVRRRFVRPDTERGGDDAFLFDHALIRDATYASIAKSERARLHERLARWLDERGELDEVVGHHLERAAVSAVEAGNVAPAIAREAAERLGRAGERAVWRRDNRVAVALLNRAIALRPETDAERLELECLLSIPLKSLWQWERALELLEDVERRAVAIGSRRLELRARTEQVWPRLVAGSADTEETMETLGEALEVCESEGDRLGVARTWFALVTAEGRMRGRFDAAADASRRAVDSFARYGASGVADALHADALADSSAPVSDAIRFCESVLERENVPLDVEGGILVHLAWSTAHTGRIEESRQLLDRARARFIDVGDTVSIETLVALCAAHVDLLGRDVERVDASARAGLDAAMARGDRIWTTHFNGVLADAAVLEGEYQRALELAESARETATETDVHQALSWRGPRARALAGLGRFDDAELCAREMSDIADGADYLLGRGEARLALGSVLARMERLEEAVTVAEEALVLLEAKGATLLAGRARAQITALRGGEPEVRAPLGSA
ncbi:MAG TPA: BTAD domain-containing putative transcriptional regulator, partial [Gaiellaceae bacterium]|nr:BTAD domain-containing putative transcriptional regulator [Gaiellaceae bacterium]